MFSKDKRHYRPTPRTLNDAFGPYSRLEPLHIRDRFDRMSTVVGVLVFGVLFGALMFWGV